MSRKSVLVLFFLALSVNGCGGPGSGGGITFSDPAGDEFGGGIGTGYDITQVQTSRDASMITIVITFVQPLVIPAAGGSATSSDVVAKIDIDTDQNGATGNLPATSVFCLSPVATIGSDYIISSFSRNDNGTYDVLDTALIKTGETTPSVSGNSLTFEIPLSALGGDDGQTDVEIVVGNGPEPTDCIPDAPAGVITTIAGQELPSSPFTTWGQ